MGSVTAVLFYVASLQGNIMHLAIQQKIPLREKFLMMDEQFAATVAMARLLPNFLFGIKVKVEGCTAVKKKNLPNNYSYYFNRTAFFPWQGS